MVSDYNNDYKNEGNKNNKDSNEKTPKENDDLISNKLLSDNLDLEISLEKIPF